MRETAKQTYHENLTLKEACIRAGCMPVEEYDQIVRPDKMTGAFRKNEIYVSGQCFRFQKQSSCHEAVSISGIRSVIGTDRQPVKRTSAA